MLILASITYFALLSIALTAATYALYKAFKKLNHQIGISMKTQYVSVRELRSFGYKIDNFSKETQKTAEQQRKSQDQQRIMVASLNRQMLHLESMLIKQGTMIDTQKPVTRDQPLNHSIAESKNKPVRKRVRRHFSSQAAPAVRLSELVDENSFTHPKRKSGVAYLEELFTEHASKVTLVENSEAGSPEPGSPRVNDVAELNTQFASQPSQEPSVDYTEQRRVQNG